MTDTEMLSEFGSFVRLCRAREEIFSDDNGSDPWDRAAMNLPVPETPGPTIIPKSLRLAHTMLEL